MRDIGVSFIILTWAIFCVGGSIWLYGWHGWSGWWVVLGVLMAGSAKDSKYKSKAAERLGGNK